MTVISFSFFGGMATSMLSLLVLALWTIQWPRLIIATCPAMNWLSIVSLPGIGETPSTWIRSCRNCRLSATFGSSMLDFVHSSSTTPVPLEKNQGWTKKFWFGTS